MTRILRRSFGFAIALMWLAALVVAPATAQAAMNQGGGLGFSCDVNTTVCDCTGSWEGADCQAMSKNCDFTGTIHKACGATGCRCWMKPAGTPPARTGGKPSVKGVKPKALAN